MEQENKPAHEQSATQAAEYRRLNDKLAPDTETTRFVAELEDVYRDVHPLRPDLVAPEQRATITEEERAKYENTAYQHVRETFMDHQTGAVGGPYTEASIAERRTIAANNYPEGVEDLRRSEEAKYADSVTSLRNQAAFQAALETAKQRRLEGKQDSMSSYDMNRFKLINDNYGHPMGDEALKMMGDIMAKAAAMYEVPERNIFRLGGDEMAVYITDDADHSRAQAVHDTTRQLMEEMLNSDHILRTPEGKELSMAELRRMGIGISGSVGATYEQADNQLKRRKEADKYGTVPVVRTLRKYIGRLRGGR